MSTPLYPSSATITGKKFRPTTDKIFCIEVIPKGTPFLHHSLKSQQVPQDFQQKYHTCHTPRNPQIYTGVTFIGSGGQTNHAFLQRASGERFEYQQQQPNIQKP